MSIQFNKVISIMNLDIYIIWKIPEENWTWVANRIHTQLSEIITLFQQTLLHQIGTV